MNIHKNARLTPIGRERMVRQVLSGLAPEAAARAAGVSPRTVSKWLKRYREEGSCSLQDRSSRPHKVRAATPDDVVEHIIVLRRQRLTGKHIARQTGVLPATVSRVLKRAGLSRMKDLDPTEPERRYEHANPGDMIHLDIKKFGKFDRPGHRVTGDRTGQSAPRSRPQGGYGWEYLHVCVDDASRIAFTDILPNEKKQSAVDFLKAAVKYYRGFGVTISRVMTDNGSCYKSKLFAQACTKLGLKHIRTKPYTPRTNGKAERFIQTAIREWAYARSYQSSHHRANHLATWTHMYNWHRPHSGIKDQTPISRLRLDHNNLLRLHKAIQALGG